MRKKKKPLVSEGALITSLGTHNDQVLIHKFDASPKKILKDLRRYQISRYQEISGHKMQTVYEILMILATTKGVMYEVTESK